MLENYINKENYFESKTVKLVKQTFLVKTEHYIIGNSIYYDI